MKYIAIILLVLLCQCSHYLPASPPPLANANTSILIKVECKKDQQVENEVLQMLRLGRVNDWEKDRNSSTVFIKARYDELAPDKAMQIATYIQRIPGVLDVQIIKDGVPVKNL